MPLPSALISSVLPSTPLNQGVRAFSFSDQSKYIVSGAARKLLIWDPFNVDTISVMDRLSGPVIDVQVSEVVGKDGEEAGKIYAIIGSAVREVRVWDSASFVPLQTVCDNIHSMNSQVVIKGKGARCLSAMLFVPHLNQLYTAGNRSF